MPEQYADSDYLVNRDSRSGIRITALSAAKLAEVDAVRESDPTTEFIRVLIRRWEDGGGKLKDLAAAAGLAKSMPSQIKARTSAASFYSATKLAKPFGYADFPDLVNAAWTWWQSDRTQIPAGHVETPRAEAMRLAVGYGVTQDQIGRVIQRFPSPRYDHHDALWWLSRFHEERSLDAEQERELVAHGRAEAAAKHVRDQKHAEHQALVKQAQVLPKKKRSHAG